MKKTKKISLFYSVFPILILVVLLSINVFTYGDASLDGSNQFILLIGGFIASLIGFKNNISFKLIIDKIGKNLKTTTSPILILLFVGALGGTWLASGIIPAMIFYGLKIINPTIFLPTAVILAALTSLVTGSSWSTSATIGIALIGIGQAMGINPEITAGAVISGAYFGDKLSPLSDTTNLASAIAECDLFSHIKYLLYTTLPSIFLTMIVFTYFCLLKDTKHIVKCISASRKMQFCKSIGWIESIPKGYVKTKECSINVVEKLFGDSPPECWIKSKKKDDLSDVIIQAFAYCDKLV